MGHAGARVAEESLPLGGGWRRKNAELRTRTQEVAVTHAGLIKKIKDMKEENRGLKVLLGRRCASWLVIRASLLQNQSASKMAAEQRSMSALKQLQEVCRLRRYSFFSL